VKCFACECDATNRKPSTAFIAGITFALQSNAKAIAGALCRDHQEAIAHGHNGTKGLVKPGQERRP
jgi:hypothetical protein